MNIKLELLKNFIHQAVNNNFESFEIDADKDADTVAIMMLSEIQNIIRNEDYNDFDVVEEIVSVFEKYKVDFGARHDF